MSQLDDMVAAVQAKQAELPQGKCACDANFPKLRPWQKFCSPKCRALFHKLDRKLKSKTVTGSVAPPKGGTP